MMRIEAIDLLRGLVMVVMVIDHAREYANLPAVSDPMDIAQTSPALFFTRWISHFCAPVFVMLAGMSARLVAEKYNDRRKLADYLWRRGAVLILLEFTVIWFAWPFNFGWKLFYMQVIWAIGCGMIFLAGLVRLPARNQPLVVGVAGSLLVFGHNLLDRVSFAPGTVAHYLWSIFHQKNVLPLAGGYAVRTTYPLAPLLGLIALGYCLGGLYRPAVSAAQRQRWLGGLGLASVSLFLVLRLTNFYGEQNQFAWQADATHTLMSLFNVTKYPTSLQFLLMTLGPALGLLIAFERWQQTHMKAQIKTWMNWLLVFGRVPMFYYIAHLYLLHILGLLAALLVGYPLSSFDFTAKITGMPVQFGFPLWGVYVFSALTILLLYPMCAKYGAWRKQSRSWIARYI